jgi:protein gp37
VAVSPGGWDPLAGDGAGLDEDTLAEPSRWDRPRVVAVAPGRDLFDAAVEAATIARLMSVVAATPAHAYLVLTSRAKRLLALGNEGLLLPKNLWVGVTVSSDDDVWRVEDLLRCNTPRTWVCVDSPERPVRTLPVEMLSWVVCECGPAPGARLDAAAGRDLRDRCVAAGVPLCLRRRGAHATTEALELDGETWDQYPDGFAAGR